MRRDPSIQANFTERSAYLLIREAWPPASTADTLVLLCEISMSNNYHVIWRQDGWAIRREGGLRDSITRIPTKDSALQQGKELAQKSGGELIPHRKDNGQFSKHGRNSYGNDPFPPRG